MRFVLIAIVTCATACTAGLGAKGAHCSTSEECGQGLLCDTTQTPHICSATLAHVDDFAMNGQDLTGVGDDDLAYPKGDMAGQKPQDMSASAHDMAEPVVDMAKPTHD